MDESWFKIFEIVGIFAFTGLILQGCIESYLHERKDKKID
jgi:hypothetical protein